jgi:hypothetical protein
MKNYKQRDRKLWRRKHGEKMDKSLKRILVDLIYRKKK